VILLSDPPTRLNPRGTAADRLRPSEYTAALIHVVRRLAPELQLDQVAEIGTGSGTVLACLAELGAAGLFGVDIEAEAVDAADTLLNELGFGNRASIFQGNLWTPLQGRRFDLVVANLPHFPTQSALCPDRSPEWSQGGRDGRRLLDPFLEGLPAHLMPGGRALITHNAFVDIDRSRRMLRERGLDLRSVYETLVFLSGEKLASLSPEVLARCEGHTIHCHGPYAFAEMHIVEIACPDDLAGCVDR